MENCFFSAINGFEFFINHGINSEIVDATELDGHHIHDTCEIYINISGDVSFRVENNIYHVKHGDAIITRPYEYHHCIYHSSATHEHYWILFSSNGNEKLLAPFFKRKVGEGNHIVMREGNGKQLINVCERIIKSDDDEIERMINFWMLIQLLEKGRKNKSNTVCSLHTDLRDILNYINKQLPEQISVAELAARANMSINTLERKFKEEFGMAPKEFIIRKRLNIAALSLRNGGNVQEAGLDGGFNDISYFIKQFSRYYGITPYKYSKAL